MESEVENESGGLVARLRKGECVGSIPFGSAQLCSAWGGPADYMYCTELDTNLIAWISNFACDHMLTKCWPVAD